MDNPQLADRQQLRELEALKNQNKNLKYLVQALTESRSKQILGNTRLDRQELDLIVLNKQIGELIYNNMLNYYKHEKNYNKNKLEKIKTPVLMGIVDKNLLGRWSFSGLSKEELITLGIGSFKAETTDQIGQSMASRIPIIGKLFR